MKDQPKLKKPIDKQLIRKYKIILWTGIFIIVFAGLLVSVYFIFVQQVGDAPDTELGSIKNVNLVSEEGDLNQVLSVDLVISNADELHGKTICVLGYYEGSFEKSVLGASYKTSPEGRSYINTVQQIWAPIKEGQYTELSCSGENRTFHCFGQIKVCGKFNAVEEGQVGLGHLGAYQYAIEPDTTGVYNCNSIDDCQIDSCTGNCYEKNYLRDPNEELTTCEEYDEYTCICVNKTCTSINKRDVGTPKDPTYKPDEE